MSESGRQVKGWFIPEPLSPAAYASYRKRVTASAAALLRRQAAERARLAQKARDVATARRGLAYVLSANGATGAEIGRILKITPGRVRQLIAHVQIRTEQAADRRFPLREPYNAQEFADRQALRERRVPGHPSPRALALNCVLARDHVGECRPCY